MRYKWRTKAKAAWLAALEAEAGRLAQTYLVADLRQKSQRVAGHLRSQAKLAVDAVHELVRRRINTLATVEGRKPLCGVAPQAGQPFAFGACLERVDARAQHVLDAGEAPGRHLGLGEAREVLG